MRQSDPEWKKRYGYERGVSRGRRGDDMGSGGEKIGSCPAAGHDIIHPLQ